MGFVIGIKGYVIPGYRDVSGHVLGEVSFNVYG
jgi:hypothetical protein